MLKKFVVDIPFNDRFKPLDYSTAYLWLNESERSSDKLEIPSTQSGRIKGIVTQKTDHFHPFVPCTLDLTGPDSNDIVNMHIWLD